MTRIREHRAAATTAGVLYIIGTVAGVLAKVLVQMPVRDAPDPLAYAGAHPSLIATGAVLVLVMGLALAFVPVVLFPVLRPVNEALAIGYLTLRGAVEATCYVISAITLLALVPVSTVLAAGPGTASPAAVRLGLALIDSDATAAVLSVVFCLGGAMFYILLYRSGIAPRWLAVWGLVALPLYLGAFILAMYGVIGSSSTQLNLLVLPLAVQEMVLGIWMIARGFRPAAASAAAQPTTRPLAEASR
jgi:hypothetical protein